MKIINQNEFDEIISEGVTLVDFFANWCGPCKMLGPVLEDLEQEYPDISFVKVDCDENMELCERFSILSIPAVFMFKDGKLLLNTGGYRDKNGMKVFIEEALKR